MLSDELAEPAQSAISHNIENRAGVTSATSSPALGQTNQVVLIRAFQLKGSAVVTKP